MKRILIVGAGAAFLGIAGPGYAADFPTMGPIAAARLFNWSGFYVGLNAGYSAGDTRINYDLPAFAGTMYPAGFIGGAQVGYNWQSGSLVLGLEADLAWRNGASNLGFAFPGGIDFALFHVEHNWLGTVRPRLGFAADNWLLYVTGGLAFGGLQHSYTESRPSTPGAIRTASQDITRLGWTLGTGVEYAFGPQLSVGFEYLYVDLGRSILALPAQVIVIAFPADSTRFRDTSHVVRAKLNWRFGS